MERFPRAALRQGFPVLLAGMVAFLSFPLLSPEGWAFRQSTLNFHYLSPWIAAICSLFMLGRVAKIFQEVLLHRLATIVAQTGESAESGDQWGISRRAKWAAGCHALAEGLALTLIAGALIAAVPNLPAIFSDRETGSVLTKMEPFLGVFGSLIFWTLPVLTVFAIGRAAKELWPAYRNAWELPRRRLIVLAVLYLLLADNGLLTLVFGFSSGLLLPVLSLAVALPFFSSLVRQGATVAPPRWANLATRVILPIFGCAEVALFLGVMVSLPGGIGRIPLERYGAALETFGPSIQIFDTLSLWSVVLLAPFILVRVVAAFRPAVGEVLGFPIGRLNLFALALILFSGNGLLTVAVGLELSHVLLAVGMALVLSYLVLVLRRVSGLGLPERVVSLLVNVLPLAVSFAVAVSISLVAWAVIGAFPSLIALILDNDWTTRFGETFLPVFASLYESRVVLTGFTFAFAFTVGLPNPLWSPARWLVRPAMTCVGFSAAGCLSWIAGVQTSELGHAYTLAGAIVGMGLVALGLSQLAAYAVASSQTTLSGAAGWLRGSSQRPFWIGATMACYAMLLRPLIYETLWFAEIYEWLVFLALTLFALLKIRGGFRSYVVASEAVPPTWTRWHRHEQEFVDRPDPRQELVARWHQRFVDHGEWAGLWSYLMELLYRNGSAPESVASVIRPLRGSLSSRASKLPWSRGEQDARRRRELALADSLKNAETALSNPPATLRSSRSSLEVAAEDFIETGADLETMAALLIDDYQRRGAEVPHAVNLWFPLVDVFDAPIRWFDPPWVRRRKRADSRDRRRRLVESAIDHLSGRISLESLPVAVAAQPLVVFPNSSANAPLGPTGVISSGQSFELLRELDSSYQVRSGRNVQGFIPKSALQLQPILPGDKV